MPLKREQFFSVLLLWRDKMETFFISSALDHPSFLSQLDAKTTTLLLTKSFIDFQKLPFTVATVSEDSFP